MQEIAVEFVYAIKTRRRFNRLAKVTFRISTRLTSLLFAMRTSTVATASKKVTMYTSTHNLWLSSLKWKVLYFLLSRVNKLDRDFLHRQLLSFVCPPRNQVTLLFPISPLARAKMAGIVNKVYSWRRKNYSNPANPASYVGYYLSHWEKDLFPTL